MNEICELTYFIEYEIPPKDTKYLINRLIDAFYLADINNIEPFQNIANWLYICLPKLGVAYLAVEIEYNVFLVLLNNKNYDKIKLSKDKLNTLFNYTITNLVYS